MQNSVQHEICLGNESQITINANSFLLNIAEHGNFSANKYENANYCWHFHYYQQRNFHAQLCLKKNATASNLGFISRTNFMHS